MVQADRSRISTRTFPCASCKHLLLSRRRQYFSGWATRWKQRHATRLVFMLWYLYHKCASVYKKTLHGMKGLLRASRRCHSHVWFVSYILGKLIKRQRLPKNDVGDHWHWKDLNNGVNVVFYGKVFHIYDCDKWTNVITSAVLFIYIFGFHNTDVFQFFIWYFKSCWIINQKQNT